MGVLERELVDQNSEKLTQLIKRTGMMQEEFANESSKSKYSKYPNHFGPYGCESNKIILTCE